MGTMRVALACCALVFLEACGGGGGGATPQTPPAPPVTKATGLAYTDPTTGDFRLVKDAASTNSKIILRLVGPAASTGRGVAFTLAVDPTLAVLVKVVDSDAEYIQNGDAFVLGEAPRFLKGIKQGGMLRATAAQKGLGSVRALDATLVRLALQFNATSGVNAGMAIPITMTEAQYLPASGEPLPITITAGTLQAQ
jgi:hypothetical protein